MARVDKLRHAARRWLPRSAVVPWWISALAVGLVLAMLALGGMVIDQGRRETWAAQRASSDRLRGALERDSGRTISAFDQSPHGLLDALSAPAIDGADPAHAPVPQIAAGSIVEASVRDGGRRLTTVRRIGGLPLVLTASVASDAVLAERRPKSAMTGGVIFTLCAAVLALLALFRREMKRRAAAELALAAAADELQHLARTDALTGLPNRRAFDDELAREWRRAIRAGEPISLLMLDADRFKAFNDRHGHQRGDEVLRAIAVCLQGITRRPADLATRYGGEEFAVVLPGTDEAGALKMAESIRAAVEALDIRHADDPVGRMTVSVGVGTLSPLVGWDSALLLRVADAALYAAKRQGRNRVASGDDPSETASWPGPGPSFAA